MKNYNNFFTNLLEELNRFDLPGFSAKGKPTTERQFLNEVRLRKEINSEHVWRNYYVPEAVKQIFDEQGYISSDDNKKVEYLAHSLMFKDMADGKLSELYRFNESEV